MILDFICTRSKHIHLLIDVDKMVDEDQRSLFLGGLV